MLYLKFNNHTSGSTSMVCSAAQYLVKPKENGDIIVCYGPMPLCEVLSKSDGWQSLSVMNIHGALLETIEGGADER
tara:strand:+ start:56651 stop:56878 length:228 start_codon:yes stop_codon:yes gene_type:complete